MNQAIAIPHSSSLIPRWCFYWSVLWSLVGSIATAGPEVTIRGQVLNEQNQPVGGVQVSTHLDRKTPLHLKSDAQGRFELKLLRSSLTGSSLQASTEDGLSQGFYRFQREDVSSADDEIEITLSLLAAAQSTVRVVGANEQPIAGVTVGLVGTTPDASLNYGTGYRDAKTDSRGEARIYFPQTWSQGIVLAIGNGFGLDFRSFNEVSQTAVENHLNPVLELSDLPLKLTGAQPLRFRVTNWSGDPIRNVLVYIPRVFRAASRESLNIQRIPSALYGATTDAEGRAEIAWYPEWADESKIGGMAGDESTEYAWTHFTNLQPEADGAAWIRMSRNIPLQGTVHRSDGTLVANVEVEVSQIPDDSAALRIPEPCNRERETSRLAMARSGQLKSVVIRHKTVTNENGRYEILLPPGPRYGIIARETSWISSMRSDVACWEGVFPDDVDLVTVPATRVSGQVIVNGQPSAMAKYHFSLLTYPGNHVHPPKHVPFVTRFTTDADGRYEVELGPGHYMTALELFARRPKWTPFFQIGDNGGEIVMDFVK